MAGTRVDVDRMLDEYRAMTMAELFERLPSKEPRRHLYNLLPQYPLRASAGVRPALLLATCQAFGGTTDDALGAAVALELFHNACLVHDDIGDKSDERRHRPALHMEHGRALAMTSGSALASASQRALINDDNTMPRRVRPFVLEEFDAVVARTLEGQATDLGWVRSNLLDLDYGDYLGMVTNKTSWYTAIGPCRIGALIGTRGRADLDVLIPFGFNLGGAFQLRDDLTGHCGRKPGSRRGGNDDLLEGKRTLMLVHLLGHVDGRERETLRRFLARDRKDRTEDAANTVRAMMEACGSVDFARHCLTEMAEAAAREFEIAFRGVGESRAKQFLRQLGPKIFAEATR
ncbi:MAG: polyprenyl synthetase family protein [Actinomycetota bacterium]|nr:polyprenyl synthetase family protein [Actinomycetota bacterium]